VKTMPSFLCAKLSV